MKVLNGIKNDFIRFNKRKNGEKDWYEVNDEDYDDEGYLKSTNFNDRNIWN